jgi:hypothetical protein
MTARFAFVVSGVLLAMSAISAAIWWVLLAKQDVPADWRVWVFLVGLACIQIASWIVILRLLVRVKGRLVWLIGVIALCVISVCANVLNGLFGPAAGMLLGVFVLFCGATGLVAARRLTTFCS